MDFKLFYKTIQFDIDKEIRTVLQATQGDTKSRGLLVPVVINSVVTPVTTETMNFFALKPDGTRVMTAGVKDGDKFRIDFTNQTFSVAGTLLCALVLYGTNGEKIADKKFKMTVDTSLEDGAIISEDERGILDRAFDLASDIVPRLEALDVPLLENLEQEVIAARGTEPTLGERLDSTDVQLSEKVQNFKLTNDIFQSALTLVSRTNNFSFANGSWFYTAEGGFSNTVAQSNGNAIPVDNICYIRAKIKPNKTTRFKLVIGNNITQPYTHLQEGVFTTLSYRSVRSNRDRYEIWANTSGLTEVLVEVKEFLGVNLTQVFGAGSEPTNLEMDELMKVIPNQWWDGELTLTQKQYITWLLKNAMASGNEITDDGTGTIYTYHLSLDNGNLTFNYEEVL